jgi:hypothetical protein
MTSLIHLYSVRYVEPPVNEIAISMSKIVGGWTPNPMGNFKFIDTDDVVSRWHGHKWSMKSEHFLGGGEIVWLRPVSRSKNALELWHETLHGKLDEIFDTRKLVLQTEAPRYNKK